MPAAIPDARVLDLFVDYYICGLMAIGYRRATSSVTRAYVCSHRDRGGYLSYSDFRFVKNKLELLKAFHCKGDKSMGRLIDAELMLPNEATSDGTF